MAEELDILDDGSALVEATSTELITEEQDDTSACIAMPTYKDVTPEKVIRSMREVFKGFTFDANDNGIKFETIDQVAQYMQASLDDIRKAQEAGETAKMMNTSAALARFWCMGAEVDKALKSSSYGNGACNQLAAKLDRSVPYVYQIRDVAKQLTIEDCWLLGIRGCHTTTLRKLAQIKDPDTCKQIIAAFIADTTDTSDVTRIERATRSFKSAINDACKHVNMLQQATTNPDEVVTDPSVLVNPSYGETIKAFDDFERKIKKVATEDYVCKFCDTMADFAITSSVPNAQGHLDSLKARAAEIRSLIETTKAYLDDIETELDSLSKVEVSK